MGERSYNGIFLFRLTGLRTGTPTSFLLAATDAAHPAKHLFGLHRAGQSSGRNLNSLSSLVIKRRQAVQKHTAVNPAAIQAQRERLSRQSGLQFFADVRLGRMFQNIFSV
jgi:hypothetical protein